jgi:hydroxymethylpyrimidine pyrophosphatase-like HAD family hydrolase
MFSENSEPWLIATDIDGTLAGFNESVSPVVAEAVREVADAGHHIVLASGRSFSAMLDIAAQLGRDTGWMVCSNGSVIVRLDPDLPGGMQVTEVIKFDPEPVLRLLAAKLPGARFAVEDLGVGFRANELFPKGELWGDLQVVDMNELWDRDVTRIIVRGRGDATEDFRETVASLGMSDVSYAVGFTDWLDISPKGVTKASALESLRSSLGIPQERTFAIGDGFNDVEMLEWAARGIAMGNAEDGVKERADEVADTVQNDGAAKALRTLL